MDNDEFFSKPINTVERAKEAYLRCGCTKYYMWHDYTDRYVEYEKLKIPETMELTWAKEAFIDSCQLFCQGEGDYGKNGEYGLITYASIVDRAKQIKEIGAYQKVIEITGELIRSEVPYLSRVIGQIVGTNGCKTHGGLIEALVENNCMDMAKKAYYHVVLIFAIVNKMPVEPEHGQWIGWEDKYLDEILNEYPFLADGFCEGNYCKRPANPNAYKTAEYESVEVFTKENRVLVLTKDKHNIDYLYGYDLDGKLIFKLPPPEHYKFWYKSGKRVACVEADAQAKKSPLSGWWFSVDFDTGKMTMDSPAY